MKIFSVIAAGLVSMLAMPAALAQADWPSKPLRFVLPATAGTSSELLMRIVYEPVAKAFGTTTIMEYKPGVAGTLALTDVAKAAPDGYTFGIASLGSLGIAPSLYAKTVRFDPTKDFVGVARLVGGPNVIVVVKDLPVRTMQELIAHAKANPGKLNFGVVGGYGTSFHMTWVRVVQQTGINLVNVPFKGMVDAMQGMLSGAVQVSMNAPNGFINQIRDGSLRPLAVTTAKRAAALPDVPTLAEAGVPGIDAPTWFGTVAPAGTPRAIIERMSSETLKVLAMPAIVSQLEKIGFETDPQNAAGFDAFFKAEFARWASVVKTSGFTPE
jgi:tripartite-type tricarboxylate transporter receptor subunit TctC